MKLGLAPSGLVLTQMFKEMAEAMRVVPLTARLNKLLDLSADVSTLLPFQLPASSSGPGHCVLDEEEEGGAGRSEGASDDAMLTSIRNRLFAVEMLLFPHALGREWTQEKRNAFRRRLASVRTVGRMVLLLHQFVSGALDSLRGLASSEYEKPPGDNKPSKANTKAKHYLPALGDEVRVPPPLAFWLCLLSVCMCLVCTRCLMPLLAPVQCIHICRMCMRARVV